MKEIMRLTQTIPDKILDNVPDKLNYRFYESLKSGMDTQQ